MATQTQVLKRNAVQPARIHDYLYDPLCTLSGVRDHARATFVAKTGTEQVQAVPVYQHLFSDLRQYPRFAYRLQSRDPVPTHVSRQWLGQAEAHRDQIALSRLFTGNDAFVVPPRTYDHVDVGGRERSKFFRKPLIPFMESVQPLLVLDTGRSGTGTFVDMAGHPGTGLLSPGKSMMSSIQPATRTQAIQTDYMEREAQTDPYTPEYVVKPGEQPEVLTLATLMYKKGLPAGLAEVEMIERARAKRQWEASLPPLDDPQQWEKRFKMMSDMERHEWLLRENEIEKLQNLRIELLEKMLKDNETRRHDGAIERINRQWSKKQIQREEFVKTNRLHYLRAIRGLLKKRSQIETKYIKNDIIRDYTKFESAAYGPLTRNGYFPDKLTDKYLVKSRFLDTYTGLLELESTLPSNALKIRLPEPKRLATTKDGHLKRHFRRERDLTNIFKDIAAEKEKKLEEPKPLRFLVKVEKPIPRPPTPSVDVPNPEDEEREKSLLELESTLPSNALKIRLPEPKRLATTKDGHLKRHFRRERDLTNIFKDIAAEKEKKLEEPKPLRFLVKVEKPIPRPPTPSVDVPNPDIAAEKEKKLEEPKPLRFLVKVEKPIPRPPTPSVDVPNPEDEEREKSIIYLQKLLRGRATQNMMYKNKEERIELIEEMRSTHALQEQDMNMKKLQRQDIHTAQYVQRKDISREDFIDSILQTLEGEAMGDMMDYLSKELIRLQEERRIAAFAMLADRQRRLREAEESGLRQVEERRRREQDELFKQTLKMTQNTVDSYLEDVILASTLDTSTEQTRTEIHEQAVAIDEIAHDMEAKRTQLESEGIVAELVHGFLIPEVAKQESRNKVRLAQHKYLLAAHQVVKDSSAENLNESAISERQQSASTNQQDQSTNDEENRNREEEADDEEQNRTYERDENEQGEDDENRDDDESMRREIDNENENDIGDADEED
ncbi:unnamed protein product [Adineta steineri]|uniref:Cilia- and flagella-associated protein 91 n=1 Tax=Adineta steineri TaxID=433720 RepID=A0A813YLD4_9BILA|nr:unnamed protein product [Adineta steineri]